MARIPIIMALFRKLFPAQINRREWHDYLAELERNHTREDRLTIRLRISASGIDPERMVAEILALRERRVEILHALGWHGEADALAADTAMRWTWALDADTSGGQR